MKNQEILDNAPKGATHIDDEHDFCKDGFFFRRNYSKRWIKSEYIAGSRSLKDIRRIVELEKDRDIRDLEQQAMGLADYVSKVMDSSYILHLDPKNTNHCILINLNAAALRLLDRAQALKEQVKP